MNNYPVYLQDDEMSCGVYALKMIFKYYGVEEETLTLKMKARMDAAGTTVMGLMRALEAYHVEAKAYHATIDDLKKEAVLPCILHTINAQKQGHFVVLYALKQDGTCVIGDPAEGLLTLSLEELDARYTKNMIQISHFGRYYDFHELTYPVFLRRTFRLYKRDIIRMGKLSALMAVISYALSGLYAVMVDSLQTNSPVFLSLVLPSGYLVASGFRLLAGRAREREVILFERALDKEYMYKSVVKVLDLPEESLYQGDGTNQARLMDLSQLAQFSADLFQSVLSDGVMCVVLLIGMCVLSRIMTLTAVLFLALMGVYVYFLSKRLCRLYRDHLQAHHKHVNGILEFLRLRDTGRRYLGKKAMVRKYEALYDKDAEVRQDSAELSLDLSQGIEAISALESTCVLLIGLLLYHKGMMSLGLVLMFYNIQSLMIMPVVNGCTMAARYAQNQILFEHYKSFQTERRDGPVQVEGDVTAIRFENVSFAYGARPDVIAHLDLDIHGHLFLVGKNGCGKSTIIRLIRGLDENYRGEITINGIPVKDIARASMDRKIGYVGVDEAFFEGTVFDNLITETKEDIIILAQALGCEDLYDLLAMPIQSDGSPLSAGQRQKLAILRALLQDHDVYLLDEAFSHISFKEAKLMIHALFELFPEKIFVIVTHRSNLMNKGDEYAIMEGGKIKSIRVRR